MMNFLRNNYHRWILGITAVMVLLPTITLAQTPPIVEDSEHIVGTVVSKVLVEQTEQFGVLRDLYQLTINLENGEVLETEHASIVGKPTVTTDVGTNIVVEKLQTTEGVRYFIKETYRYNKVLWFILAFFLLGIALGGKKGFSSMLGLVLSIAILFFFVIPQIVAGHSPLLISIIGCIGIAVTSIYLAHGFNRRTSIAVISTIITLVIAIVIAVVVTSWLQLAGLGTEEAMFVMTGPLAHVDLRGLLLGGMIIGTLGILDDITTAQTAAIDELSKANHSLDFKELYTRGMSIGQEHIASLINSLALAYAGASLPLFLLFFTERSMPWWLIVNSEFITEEITRTLVGSTALLLAVPIATFFAAKAFQLGRHTNATGHVCHH
jgi:uncharacterized membrane protein